MAVRKAQSERLQDFCANNNIVKYTNKLQKDFDQHSNIQSGVLKLPGGSYTT